MSGIIIEPATSLEAIDRNFSRLNEAIVALQGGSIAIENIEGYENLATKLYVEDEIKMFAMPLVIFISAKRMKTLRISSAMASGSLSARARHWLVLM